MLDEILTWLFSDVLGWILLYLVPIFAIGLGIYYIVSGESFYWGVVWILGGLAIGAIVYGRFSRNRDI